MVAPHITTVEPPVSDHPKPPHVSGRLREVAAYERSDYMESFLSYNSEIYFQ